ncbi:hypothetical protein XELAEV_18041939mg, partial [Xenopus laevis]
MGRRVGVPVCGIIVRRGRIPVGSSILKCSRCTCDVLLRRSAPLPAPSLALTSCSPLATSTAPTGEGGGAKCCGR